MSRTFTTSPARWLPTILVPLLLLGTTSPASAADASSNTHGLTVVDWSIIACYGVGTIVLGWYYGRQQKTVREYFVGSGHMNPVLIGVSLFATLLSTISYLSMPGEALGKGPVWMMTILAYPVTFLIVAYWLLPVYMRQHVTSAYELLESRLGLSVRLLGATMFLSLRLVWMSLLVFLTARAMSVMLGVDESWIPLIALVTGAVAVVYTSLGGLRAVVITDFMQTVLLFGGAVLVIGTITFQLGGLQWIPTKWQAHWDHQPILSFDPSVRITVVGSIISFIIWNVCTSGGDQTSVQRFMSTADAASARRAYATQITVACTVAVTLAFVGFALMGFYQTYPERLPTNMTLEANADSLFPHFIAYELPIGISGLVVSAMFAAAMSSVDSGVNSITAVVTTDFLDRLKWSPRNERQHVLMARLLAFGIGATVVICSSLMQHVPGNITAVTNKTANLLTTPIFCLFFFALFVPFAKPLAVWIAAIVGVVTAASIAFSGPLVVFLDRLNLVEAAALGVEIVTTVDPETGTSTWTVNDPISFQWIAPVALSANILTGIILSGLLPASFRATKNQPEDHS